MLEPLDRDFGALHLADQGRVGQGVQEREGIQVDAIGLPREKQRVRLDRIEHGGGRALGNVHVDRAEMLGQNRAGRSVLRPDVLEHRRIAGLLRMVIDDQIHAVDQAAEIVRLDIHGGDPVEIGELGRRDRLDLNVQEIRHARSPAG
jgi:hypothetical protein